jgi:5'-nucleotidase
MSAADAAASKKILYIDLDNTLVDFKSGMDRLTAADVKKYAGRYDDAPGIFALMEPMVGAIDAYKLLARKFDTYILSTAPWNNPSAWQHKLEWVQLHLGVAAGTPAYKRLILSHHKNLNRGDFLVDDRPNNGASEFEGELLLFGQPPYSTWAEVAEYLLTREPAATVSTSA